MALSRTNKQTVAGFLQEAHEALVGVLEGEHPAKVELGERTRKHIVARTRGGKDVNGPMAPYAERTKREKRRKKQRIRPPSLTDTEAMLNELVAKPIGKTTIERIPGVKRQVKNVFVLSELKWNDKKLEKRASYHIHGTERMPKRDFLGVDEYYEREMAAHFGIALKRVIPTDRRKKIKVTVFKVSKY